VCIEVHGDLLRLESEEEPEPASAVDLLSSLDTSLSYNRQRGADNFSLGIFPMDRNRQKSQFSPRKWAAPAFTPEDLLSTVNKNLLNTRADAEKFPLYLFLTD
jgi:hypothetical protein